MAYYRANPAFLVDLKPNFIRYFRNYIRPMNVLNVFRLYRTDIFTAGDIDQIRAETTYRGEMAASELMFERLIIYEGWYPVLLKVLRHRDVNLSHVADDIQRDVTSWSAGTYRRSDTIETITNTLLRETNRTRPATPVQRIITSQLETEIQNLQRELDKITTQDSQTRIKFDNQTDEIKRLQENETTFRKTIIDLKKQIVTMENDLEEKGSLIAKSKSNAANLQKEIDRLCAIEKDLKFTNANLEARNKQHSDNDPRAGENIENTTALKREIKILKDEKVQLIEENKSLKAKLAELEKSNAPQKPAETYRIHELDGLL